MKQFCKIVNHDEFGQILATRETNDESDPVIKVTVCPNVEGIDLMSTAFTYDDSDEGYKKRDEIWQEYLKDDSLMIEVAQAIDNDMKQIFG